MNAPFEKIFNQIQYSTLIKSRQILHEVETSPEGLLRFCHHAERLGAGKAEILCPVLSAMTAPEYLGLLKSYALRPETRLRKLALEALQNANPSARRSVLIALLETNDEELRQEVCAILGAENTETAAQQLVRLLREESVAVLLAALEGLRNIPVNEAAGECRRLLAHADAEVRIAALRVLTELENALPLPQLLALLRDDPQTAVRLQVCRSLSLRPLLEEPQAITGLTGCLLREANPPELRAAAAAALRAYSNPLAAEALFVVYAQNLANAGLAQVCRESLLHMPENLLVPVCRRFIASQDPRQRLEAAEICGLIASNEMLALLISRLEVETDQLVVAGLLEEAGKSGAVGIWEAARERLCGDPLIAYMAVQALSRVLIPPKLREFSQILLQKHEPMIYEVVLTRLGAYGRARGLPQGIVREIIPFLHNPYSNLAVLAAEAVSCYHDPLAVSEMLAALSGDLRDEVQQALCKGIIAAVDGSLYALLAIAGEDNLLKVSAVLSRLEELGHGEGGAEYFIRVAEMAVRDIPYANLCLSVAATLKPAALSDALNTAEAEVAVHLLQVWRVLPLTLREEAPPPWARLLSMPEAPVRIEALRSIGGGDILRLLGNIADIAFIDPEPQVRAQAANTLRACLTTATEPGNAL